MKKSKGIISTGGCKNLKGVYEDDRDDVFDSSK